MEINFKKMNKGFSLVEMIIYVALLVLVVAALVNVVFSFTGSYSELTALRTAENTAVFSMERMVRDIHSATSYDPANSTLGTSPGVITLLIGTSTTKFYTVSGQLRVDVDGVYIGPLSPSSAQISNLVFYATTTAQSQAIKIDMTITGISGHSQRSQTYHTVAVLKNS